MNKSIHLSHHRHSIRLQGYDYSQAGGYYITIVANGWRCLFGEIINGEMKLNRLGMIIQDCWNQIPSHFSHLTLDEFVVMPNHIHGILFFHDENRNIGRGTIYRAPTEGKFGKPVAGSLGTILGSFKAAVSRLAARELHLTKIWQRNYYEHIIHSEADYERIAGYILANPSNWYDDDENPQKHL
jgi:REP element-mobilizing transposase RayT